MPVKIFISYAREDQDAARRIYRDLTDRGIDAWLDCEKLRVGQNWKHMISKAIKESRYFLALLSHNSLTKTGYVRKELKIALEIYDQFSPEDIFILPARLEECKPSDERLEFIHWADLFPDYDAGLNAILDALADDLPEEPEKSPELSKPPVKKPGTKPEPQKQADTREIIKLRNEPKTLSDDDVRDLIEKYNFYCGKYDWTEKWYNESGDFKNDFTDNGDGTVTDSVTGLMWEKSGSEHYIIYDKTHTYIDDLNRNKFAGYNNWRLPTLEELASLLESKKVDSLFIDPVFDRKQLWCWTADKRASGGTWFVFFYFGYVYWPSLGDNGFVRAVRFRTM